MGIDFKRKTYKWDITGAPLIKRRSEVEVLTQDNVKFLKSIGLKVKKNASLKSHTRT